MKIPSYLNPAHSFGGRFFLLFLFLLNLLILGPFAGDSGTIYAVFRVVELVITFLSVYVLSFRRSFLVVAIALAIPAALSRGLLPRQDAGVASTVIFALTFAFDVIVVISIFRRVIVGRKITSDSIYGAVCIYLLVGFGFSNLYLFLWKLQAHAFYLPDTLNLHSIPDRNDFVFYSFATLTSLGSNGIIPVTPQARSLSVLEAILGVLYLAVLVSRLVGAYRPDENT
jgi:Ion channel